jgi:hypothetical protein
LTEREVCITVRVTTIRDGTQGISLSAPDKVLGEWQDSGAFMLRIAGENSISVCGAEGQHRYMLSLPGTCIKSELLSATEALVIIRI